MKRARRKIFLLMLMLVFAFGLVACDNTSANEATNCGDEQGATETIENNHAEDESLCESTVVEADNVLKESKNASASQDQEAEQTVVEENIAITAPVPADEECEQEDTVHVIEKTPIEPEKPNVDEHICEYAVDSIILGDCTTKGYTIYTCACGDNYQADYVGENGHTWVEIREDVPIYETVCFTRCGYCHADITGNVSAHVKEEALAGNGSRSYQSYEQVQIGIENQVVGYSCGVCGIDK